MKLILSVMLLSTMLMGCGPELPDLQVARNFILDKADFVPMLEETPDHSRMFYYETSNKFARYYPDEGVLELFYDMEGVPDELREMLGVVPELLHMPQFLASRDKAILCFEHEFDFIKSKRLTESQLVEFAVCKKSIGMRWGEWTKIAQWLLRVLNKFEDYLRWLSS